MDLDILTLAIVLVIIYCNDGVGITGEDKKKLFQKWFSNHTGPGLFLSKETISNTGIKIREIGEPGKGARFEITVPKSMWLMAGNGA
ncbi:MAG: ATP-binding protein [Methanoregula sp.]|nr:ATP-binding protein [Methanoregula sp.]